MPTQTPVLPDCSWWWAADPTLSPRDEKQCRSTSSERPLPVDRAGSSSVSEVHAGAPGWLPDLCLLYVSQCLLLELQNIYHQSFQAGQKQNSVSSPAQILLRRLGIYPEIFFGLAKFVFQVRVN